MSRGRVTFLLLSLALVVPLLSTGLRRALAEGDGEDSLYKQLSVFSEVLHLIRRAYVDEVAPEKLLAAALDGAADALDPLSTFVPAGALEEYAAARAIGASRSGLVVVKERGIALVVAVAPGSPAEQAGVEGRDVVVEIDARPTRRMPLWEIQSVLAGEPGTRLELALLRRGQPERVELELAAYPRAPARLSELDGEAVLRIPDCEPVTVAETAVALSDLAAGERRRLLVDLRGVAGGDPAIAYAIAEQFARGPLGSLRDRGGEITGYAGEREPLWQGPLVVLIDRGTMGCAELLATVLRQSAGAQLVGQPSFGHAGRMEMLPLSSGAALLTTDAFYAGPDGEPLSDALTPDLQVSAATGFGDDDRPLADIMLERGLELLREIDGVPEQQAA